MYSGVLRTRVSQVWGWRFGKQRKHIGVGLRVPSAVMFLFRLSFAVLQTCKAWLWMSAKPYHSHLSCTTLDLPLLTCKLVAIPFVRKSHSPEVPPKATTQGNHPNLVPSFSVNFHHAEVFDLRSVIFRHFSSLSVTFRHFPSSWTNMLIL